MPGYAGKPLAGPAYHVRRFVKNGRWANARKRGNRRCSAHGRED